MNDLPESEFRNDDNFQASDHWGDPVNDPSRLNAWNDDDPAANPESADLSQEPAYDTDIPMPEGMEPAGWEQPYTIGDETEFTAFHATMYGPPSSPSSSTDAQTASLAESQDEPSIGPYANLEDDPRYNTMLLKMQYGKWPEVVDTLRALKTIYPDEPVLDSLLNEANLKCEIVMRWGTTIKGRRMTVRQERVLRRSIPFVLLISLAFIGLSFYQSFVAPSREVVAMSKQNKEIIADAQTLTQNGQFEEALRQYEIVLASDPENQGALQGIQETRDMMALVAEFDLAMQLADEGNIDRALAFLAGIQAKSPGFRNVDVQIKELETLKEVQTLYLTAESAYALQMWLMAVPMYEQVSELARDFESETVTQHLNHSYFQAGLQLTNQKPSPDAGPLEAQEYLRMGRSVDPEQADMHIKRLEIYFDGLESLDDGNLDEAINLWQGLYDANHAYLGGYLAGRLYAAYLSLAAEAEQQQNLSHAQNLYQQAMGLEVEDISSAQNRLAALVAAATPTPAPTIPPPAPVYVAPPPPPTATPEPDPSGWIAFRTNRNGPEEIYLMLPDGSEQKPAPAGLAMRFEELLKKETISWDGSRELRVMAIDGRTDASIYMVDLTATDGQTHQTMITNYHGDEYDPVWAPKGDRIAFVANHTGNDEIWTANPDGTDAYQITWNEWEWDKRPSFSPDGTQIVFYSNRSGWRQIWVMESNGGSQYNLSYNAYDDWDPVWIK